jgi:hypothetical protein
MITHIVLWRLKEVAEGSTKQENAVKVKAMLENLHGKIPGMLKLEVGMNIGENNTASDISLYTEFGSRDALDAYQIHPEHMKVKEFLPLVSSERRVIDYET